MTPYRAAAAAACLLFALAAPADDGSLDLGAADAARGSAAPPAAVPAIDDAGSRAAAQRAHDEVVAARERVDHANAAYAQMRSRDYPRGDARAAIVRERDAARAEYLRASAAYAEILEQAEKGE